MSGTSSNARFSKSKTKGKPASKHAEWTGFVSCELTDIHKDDLRQNPFPQTAIDEWITIALESGCKLTQSHDKNNQSFIASLTDRDPESPNAGLSLVARGSAPHKALQALMYKDRVIIGDRPWSEFAHETTRDEFG